MAAVTATVSARFTTAWYQPSGTWAAMKFMKSGDKKFGKLRIDRVR
jgi:hypothetical protein